MNDYKSINLLAAGEVKVNWYVHYYYPRNIVNEGAVMTMEELEAQFQEYYNKDETKAEEGDNPAARLKESDPQEYWGYMGDWHQEQKIQKVTIDGEDYFSKNNEEELLLAYLEEECAKCPACGVWWFASPFVNDDEPHIGKNLCPACTPFPGEYLPLFDGIDEVYQKWVQRENPVETPHPTYIMCHKCHGDMMHLQYIRGCAYCPHNGVWNGETETYEYPEETDDPRTQADDDGECEIGFSHDCGCTMIICANCGIIVENIPYNEY